MAKKSSVLSSCKFQLVRPTHPHHWSSTGSTWSEHHGVLQGVQRPDQGVEPGLPLPVVITAFADKSFTFIIKTPPATTLIKKAIKLERVLPTR